MVFRYNAGLPSRLCERGIPLQHGPAIKTAAVLFRYNTALPSRLRPWYSATTRACHPGCGRGIPLQHGPAIQAVAVVFRYNAGLPSRLCRCGCGCVRYAVHA